MAMKFVWASHKLINAAWTESGETNYDYVILFNSLTELCAQMGKRNLLDQVQILGLAAHGGEFHGGRIQLDSDLTVESIGGFDTEFRLLQRYLTRSAILTFYACAAGYGEAGSALLRGISSRLPGRLVIGFSVWGVTSPYGASHPGIMGYNRQPNCTTSEGLLSPGNEFAKWARDGQIIRLPSAEQS